MASVYQDKIYPEIPTAPPNEEQTYRLKKTEEAETFLRREMERRDKLAKQFKRRAMATAFSDTSVITAMTALEVASIATLTTGVGLSVSIVLVHQVFS